MRIIPDGENLAGCHNSIRMMTCCNGSDRDFREERAGKEGLPGVGCRGCRACDHKGSDACLYYFAFPIFSQGGDDVVIQPAIQISAGQRRIRITAFTMASSIASYGYGTVFSTSA